MSKELAVPGGHDRLLAKLDAAKAALAEATSIDEIKDVRDKAEAIRNYYRQQQDGLEAQNSAAELKLRAERRLGELLQETERHPPGPDRLQAATDLAPKLSDLGIEKTQSHRWQQIAGLPEQRFEQEIEAVRAGSEELTTARMLALAREVRHEEARRSHQEQAAKAQDTLQDAVLLVEADFLAAELNPDFHCLVADPPYNTHRMSWDDFDSDQEYRQFTLDWLERAFCLLTTEHHAFIFCPAHYAADMEWILRGLGHRPSSRIIWHRRNLSMGRVVSNALVNSYELVFHCGNCALNLDAIWSDRRFDVQTIAVPQTNFTDQKLHQTQKPLALIEWLIAIGSTPGDRVLDPFAGAGTTGIACLNLGRACTLVEREPDHAALARDRIARWNPHLN